jgi:hypothetical protein
LIAIGIADAPNSQSSIGRWAAAARGTGGLQESESVEVLRILNRIAPQRR